MDRLRCHLCSVLIAIATAVLRVGHRIDALAMQVLPEDPSDMVATMEAVGRQARERQKALGLYHERRNGHKPDEVI